MKFVPKNSIRRFLEGGAMPPEGAPMEEAPAEGGMPEQLGGEQDPLMMLVQGAALALLGQDCQIAMQVCLGLILLVQLAQGGGQEAPQGQPVYRKGGVLVRRIRK